ncbi:hypothetical protein ABZS29_29095 [Kribbella sp. NPDC005582]|uniref:hypothetical protein n=2 Tax=unclassified Kribbella TaxID=2644121 RepID=UPI0033A1D0C9
MSAPIFIVGGIMTPPRLSRRRILLSIPAVALAAQVGLSAAPAQALKKKPECLADLIAADPMVLR